MYINLETKGVGKERDRKKMMVTSALNLKSALGLKSENPHH